MRVIVICFGLTGMIPWRRTDFQCAGKGQLQGHSPWDGERGGRRQERGRTSVHGASMHFQSISKRHAAPLKGGHKIKYNFVLSPGNLGIVL